MGLSLVGLLGLGTGLVALEHWFFCVWRHLVASHVSSTLSFTGKEQTDHISPGTRGRIGRFNSGSPAPSSEELGASQMSSGEHDRPQHASCSGTRVLGESLAWFWRLGWFLGLVQHDDIWP